MILKSLSFDSLRCSTQVVKGESAMMWREKGDFGLAAESNRASWRDNRGASDAPSGVKSKDGRKVEI
jgi:hypothetical protein